MYKEKGITLIALIITIIIMLILVIVTVQIATNGGLIDKAHEASDKTKVASANETNQMTAVSSEIDDALYPANPESDFTYDPVQGITEYKGTSTVVVFPKTINGEPVNRINSSAFYNNTLVAELRIPSSVSIIDNGAFSGCTSLESVFISSGLTELNSGVFSGCTKLASVTLPNTLTTIGLSTFSSCSSLTNISIPNSVTMIEDSAFDNTPFLNNLLSENNGVAISNNILLKVDYMVQTGSSFVVQDDVKIIAEYAFASCNFTSISLSSHLIRIGRAAFIDCNDLTAIEIPSGVTTIDTQAFFHCYALANITIPASVTTIGSDAFKNCLATDMKISKPTDSISGAPWGANSGYSITWNYTP